MVQEPPTIDHPAPAAQSSSAPAAAYQQRCADFGQQRDILQRRSSRNANLSLLLIVGALASLGAWLWRGEPWMLTAAIVLGVGFVVSFIQHGRVDRALRRYVELYAINDEGLRRLQRDWATLPLRQPPSSGDQRSTRRGRDNLRQLFGPLVPLAAQKLQQPAEKSDIPAFAGDLDLLGHASLQHLLNTAATPVGQTLLRDWLLNPATPNIARLRQAAVAELAPLLDLRDQVALRGRLMGAADGRSTERPYEHFLRWAESAPWLAQRGWLLGLARAIPLITLALYLMQLLGLTKYPLWLAGIAVGVVLTATIGRAVDDVIDDVAARQAVFSAYADLFKLIGTQQFASPALRQLQSDLSADRLRADEQMRRLGRLMALADVRGWMFFYPIQLATLWSVHVLWLLERWQRAAGASARRWLLALGTFEALSALAALAHDNPDWTFPELDAPQESRDPLSSLPSSEAGVLAAIDLGHPLLPPDARVGNAVTIGPPGSFLLVTGSNMSGKSTLLRAIGVNVVLAQAGGPVCAAQLRLPPVALATSIRVQDSLEQGVSYFMAELQRLKEVVDAAEQTRAEGQRTLLFLLDEILHGTNTSERQIAARRIILHLLGLGAIGAISTHDLSLADAPELAAGQAVHFTEQFTRSPAGLTMSFDYTLRPGVATSTNALKLMEMIGLPVEDEGKR